MTAVLKITSSHPSGSPCFVASGNPAEVIQFPSNTHTSQTSNEAFFCVVASLGYVGGALALACRWMGVL